MPIDFSELDPKTRALLEDRYGINSKKGSWRWIAIALVVVGAPWLFWSAWHHSNPEIRTTLVSFRQIDEKSIEITFDLGRRKPSQSLKCTVIARDFDKNVVGELEISVPGSARSLQRQSATIPTRLRAVSAEIIRCIP